MFDPAEFSVELATKLRTLCTARLGPVRAHRLREGMDDEQRIIVGIAEGHIACRRMPDFLRSVLDRGERLRLYSTIQAQVEGQLVLTLGRGRPIPIGRQTSNGITEMILESAELLRVCLSELHRLLGLTKAISYTRSSRTIHFYFFSKAVARKVQDVRIPIQGRVYTLANVHEPGRGSVWLNQRGPDGRLGHSCTEYSIFLHNVTRFNEIGRIAAYFRSKVPTAFEPEDMDTCTPTSRASTVWKVTFFLAGCPTFLQGIVRLLWFGTPIIIEHPEVGRHLQRLHCGNLGHPAARCQFTDAQLRGLSVIEVKEEELQAFEYLAKPFSDPKEMRQMASRRLELQKSAEAAAQVAVNPAVSDVPPRRPPVPVPQPTEIPVQPVYTANTSHVGPPPPAPRIRPAQPWMTRPLRGGSRVLVQVARSQYRPHIWRVLCLAGFGGR
uniref:Uncharacterized protein n=1 Tax=Hyaloperonospora arabidopsidis (strain Emoy2) TaxID=559515 RepID=M4BBH2_HYAAE